MPRWCVCGVQLPSGGNWVMLAYSEGLPTFKTPCVCVCGGGCLQVCGAVANSYCVPFGANVHPGVGGSRPRLRSLEVSAARIERWAPDLGLAQAWLLRASGRWQGSMGRPRPPRIHSPPPDLHSPGGFLLALQGP